MQGWIALQNVSDTHKTNVHYFHNLHEKWNAWVVHNRRKKWMHPKRNYAYILQKMYEASQHEHRNLSPLIVCIMCNVAYRQTQIILDSLNIIKLYIKLSSFQLLPYYCSWHYLPHTKGWLKQSHWVRLYSFLLNGILLKEFHFSMIIHAADMNRYDKTVLKWILPFNHSNLYSYNSKHCHRISMLINSLHQCSALYTIFYVLFHHVIIR